MKKRNFTIIELLATITIISILAALILGLSAYASRKAAESKTIGKLEKMVLALEEFRSDRGHYPQASSSIEIDGTAPFAAKTFVSFETGRPYLEGYNGGEYTDGWGQAFRYRCPGSHNGEAFDLWSVGVDKTDGSEDDITNWTRH